MKNMSSKMTAKVNKSHSGYHQKKTLSSWSEAKELSGATPTNRELW
jgi:hypothetical protein